MKRVLSLLLSAGLCISLMGCNNNLTVKQPVATDPPESVAPTTAVTPDPNATPDPATEPIDFTKNIVEYASGLSQDTVLLTVNEETIPADVFLYLLFSGYTQFQYTYYMYTGQTLPDVSLYSADLEADTVTTLVYYSTLRQKAAELGVLPTEEQLQEIRDGLTQSQGTYTYEQQKTLNGLTDAGMEYVASLNAYYENVLNAVIPEPTDEELEDFVYQTKHILLTTVDTSTNEELSDEEKAEKRATIEKLLADLQAVEGEEREKLFEEYMETYSEDRRDTEGHINTDGYEAVVGDMVPEYEEASLALPIGGLSDIVESTYGYHIILRGPVTYRENTKEEYATTYREHQLDTMVADWAADESMTPVKAPELEALDLNSFFIRFSRYYNQLATEYMDAAQAAASDAGTDSDAGSDSGAGTETDAGTDTSTDGQ